MAARRRCARWPACNNFQPCKRHYGWRASESALPSGWSKTRERVRLRGRSICQSCGRYAEKGAADHIKNRAEGGSDDLSNLQWLCNGCHKLKTDEERRRGNRRRK